MSVDSAVERLVQQHRPYFKVTEAGKVLCELNGHEFQPRIDVLNSFINGKKFARLKLRQEASASAEKYDPFLVQSKNFPNMLYCTLTKELINKSVESIRLHMKGKRFQRAQARFQEDKQELYEEPEIDDVLRELGVGSDGEPSEGATASGEADEGEGSLPTFLVAGEDESMSDAEAASEPFSSGGVEEPNSSEDEEPPPQQKKASARPAARKAKPANTAAANGAAANGMPAAKQHPKAERQPKGKEAAAPAGGKRGAAPAKKAARPPAKKRAKA